jgi:anaerobic glycerol-3-phosphate dehydrogenase
MPLPKLRAVSYARDFSVTSNKFVKFDKLVQSARKDQAEAVIVALPQVLGDSYDELLVNLNKLALANLLLAIVPPPPAADRN